MLFYAKFYKPLDIDATSSSIIKIRGDIMKLYDISEVCRLLNTTSRTLRYYEEKGIVASTKSDFSFRRAYTEEQINHIRNVMVLRTIGLSIDTISKLQKNGANLKNEVIAKRAEILAYIESKSKEISLLNEAIAIIESGESIFEKQIIKSQASGFNNEARKCAEYIVFENYEELYKHFSSKLIEYKSIDVFKIARDDVLSPCGDFISFDKQEIDTAYPNIVYEYVKFSKIGLKIKLVFHNERIDGLWLSYYEV